MKKPEYKGIRNALRVQWLRDIGGCEITSEAEEKLKKIKQSLPEWKGSWIDTLTDPMVSVGDVEVDTNPSSLTDASISDIPDLVIKAATNDLMNFTDHRPFEGFVIEQPRRALLSLCLSVRKGEYPAMRLSWGTILEKWPDTASQRATQLLYQRIKQLPPHAMHQISYELGRFMSNKLPEIAQQNESFALEMFDALIEGLTTKDEKGRDYLYSDNPVLELGDGSEKTSKRTINMALNNPIGQATEGLISIIGAKQLSEGQELTPEFLSLLNSLIVADGLSSDAAICILTRQINWWYSIAPNWVEKQLVPLFNLGHSKAEPAWNGAFTASDVAIPLVFKLIKPHFLKLPPKMYSWNWKTDQQECIANWIVMTTVWKSPDGAKLLTFDEADTLVRDLSPAGRVQLFYFLNRVGCHNQEGWVNYVIPFIENSWPKENKYQTQETSSEFVSMLSYSDENFLKLLKKIKLFLRPIDSRDINLIYFYNDHNNEEQAYKLPAKQFPEEMLELLDIILQGYTYGLEKVLETIIKTKPKLKTDPRYIRLKKLA